MNYHIIHQLSLDKKSFLPEIVGQIKLFFHWKKFEEGRVSFFRELSKKLHLK